LRVEATIAIGTAGCERRRHKAGSTYPVDSASYNPL
jgi:hypothetical protein